MATEAVLKVAQNELVLHVPKGNAAKSIALFAKGFCMLQMNKK
jgi:hypothetical protein